MKRAGFYYLFTLLCCLNSFVILAQEAPTAAPDPTGKIVGRIVDNKNNPVPVVEITLLKSDSTAINGALSGDDGSFSIAGTGFGNFIIRITYMGSKAQYIDKIAVSTEAPEKNLGNIKLHSEDNALKEVTVTGEKPLMEMKVDKKVFNVEKNITTSGGSAADVLQNVPSVSVDADGTVSLRGKQDVTILIDGKPATLLGGDIQSALQSLPASSIEAVETVTNPSAKYDAQGMSGIINIITKKNNRLGVNGTLTLGVGDYDKYNGSFGLNVRKGKVNVFLNSSFRITHNYNQTITDRYNKTDTPTAAIGGSSKNVEVDPRQFNGFFNTIGFSYDINSRNSFTLSQNINVMDFSYSDFSYYSIYYSQNGTGPAASLTQRTSAAGGGPQSYSTSFDYKHKFDKKDEEMNFDATYSTSTTERTQEYTTTLYSQTATYGPVNETAPTTSTNGSFTTWADYVNPMFTQNGKFGAGWKSQFLWYNSKNDPLITYPDIPGQFLDTGLLNNFNYTQQIHAAYVNWNDQYNKFSYQAGLRVEDAIYNGSNNAASYSTYTNHFLNLFPSAFVSYQLPNQQSIYLNYSRRTNRPSFWNMLPYKDVSNPGIVQQGNPGLIPEFVDNIEFSYNKQDKRGDNFIISTYYQLSQNLIERITYFLDTGIYRGSLFVQPVNLAKGETYGFEGIGHVVVVPGWDVTASFNLFQNHIVIGSSSISQYASDQSGLTYSGKLNTNFKIPGNFSVQINANYESPKIVAQGRMEETSWMDIAIKKSLWKNKVSIVFNVSDVFDSRKYTTIYDLPQYYESYYRNRETRIGYLNITWRFGKTLLDKPVVDIPGAGKRKTKNTDNSQQGQKDRENNLKESDEPDNSNQNNNNQGGNKEKGSGTHM